MNRAQRRGIVLGVAPDSAASLLILRLKVSRKNRRVTRSIAERTRSCSFTFLVLSNAMTLLDPRVEVSEPSAHHLV